MRTRTQDRFFTQATRLTFSLSVMLAQAACTELIEQSRPERDEVFGIEDGIIPFATEQDRAQRATPSQRPVRAATVRGSDRFTAPSSRRRGQIGPLTSITADGAISLNLLDVTIPEAAKAVLGDALGINYIIDGEISGAITLQTSTPLDRQALLEAFQTALEFNGATLTESGDLVTISTIDRVSPQFVTLGDDRGLGRRIVVIPLRFVSTREMVRLLEPIVSRDVVLRVSEPRNLLMVSGTNAEIEAILDAVNLFDVNVLGGKSLALVKLNSADPEAIAEELSIIFDTGEGGTLEGVVNFIPNERLGSILVVTSRAKYVSEARAWIERLDATAGQLARYPEVYQLQNRTAEDLAPILSEIVGASEDDEEAAEVDEFLERTGSPKVVADTIKNAIVFWGTQTEQDEMARLIRGLDTTPPQVLLEATIAEVSLNDELDFGIRWFFESGDFSVTFTDLAVGAVTSSFPGFSFLFDSGDATVALNALSSITDVKIASSPSILVLDNREAELRVGDQVPVAIQSLVTTQDADAPIVNSIEFRDTGVILKVRPRVSDQGRVVMDIQQEVSSVVETTTSGIDSPTINQRSIKTSVVVDSGQTLALGGLIEETEAVTKTQVPLLGDIPFLGAAFRSRENTEERSELLILITPRVIRNASEGRLITREFRERLSAPDELLDGGLRQPRHQVRRLLN